MVGYLTLTIVRMAVLRVNATPTAVLDHMVLEMATVQVLQLRHHQASLDHVLVSVLL